jgi:Flp pilus assembly pilin Flp
MRRSLPAASAPELARPRERDVNQDDRGTVTVEYTVILSLVAVGLVLAVAALGPTLVRAYLAREAWLLLPFP